MRASYRSLRPLILWKESVRPLEWRALFGRQAPVELEIGFGNGDYLVRRARAYPERNFIGIEMEWAGVQRALRRANGEGVSNLRLILGDAKPILRWVIAPQSLTRIYSLFPCPWPKTHHHKYRLFDQACLQLVNSRLVDGGEFYLLTDHAEYFGWVLSHLTDTGFRAEARTVPPSVGTKYERKWQEGGQNRFYEMVAQKVAHCALPLPQEEPMETYRLAELNPNGIQLSDADDHPIVKFKETRYDPQRRIWMVRVVVVEDDLTQHFWIEAVYTEHGWHIRPMQGCGIVPTVGIQRALDLVYQASIKGSG
ncbi:MAG: tRNA (guanosine(46)-N7)-methyltransferase TrmB [Fimbriimonadales bacterium]